MRWRMGWGVKAAAQTLLPTPSQAGGKELLGGGSAEAGGCHSLQAPLRGSGGREAWCGGVGLGPRVGAEREEAPKSMTQGIIFLGLCTQCLVCKAG